ncbi:MAG: twin-arginine translocase subunit TatC [bacterium]|nr:twin-arginine translocase subunit TatC [bacterium]
MAAAASSDTESLNKYLPFVFEIRRRLLFTFAVLIVSAAVGFIYYERIISLVLKLFRLEGVNIVFTSPFQFLNLAVSCALLVGVLFVFPIVISQVLAFMRPALTKKEYKTVLILMPLSIVLFASGFAYGILIMRYVLTLFYAKSQSLAIGNFLDISHLLSQILMTSLLLGVAFQFPIVMTILMKLKIVKHKAFSKHHLTAICVSLIFSAFLPPTDVLSLFLMALPLIGLFELTLILNRVVLKAHLL